MMTQKQKELLKGVFITGPTKGIESLNIEAFRLVAHEVREIGLTPIIQHEVADGLDLQEWEFNNECASVLSKCAVVVTIEEWHEDELSTSLVKMAQILKKRIVTTANMRKSLTNYWNEIQEKIAA